MEIDGDRRRQTETDGDERRRQMETDGDRWRPTETETDRHRHRQRPRQTETETDRDGDRGGERDLEQTVGENRLVSPHSRCVSGLRIVYLHVHCCAAALPRQCAALRCILVCVQQESWQDVDVRR